MKRIFKFAGLLVAAVATIGVVMYALGGRIYLDGGGSPHFGFPESSIAHEQTVEQHRKAQESAVAAGPPAPSPAISSATPEAVNSSPAAPVSASTPSLNDWT